MVTVNGNGGMPVASHDTHGVSLFLAPRD